MLQSRPSQSGTKRLTSAAVKDVIAEFLHLEDRGVRAPGDRLWQMRLDDFADHDVVITLFNNAGDPAFDRSGRGIEDRGSCGAFVNGLTAQLAILQFGRLEEGEGGPLLVLAQHVQGKRLGILDDLVGASI